MTTQPTTQPATPPMAQPENRPVTRPVVLPTDGTAADFIGRGWAFPVHADTLGRIAIVGGVANLERSMRIILGTYLGERPMRPDFGSLLKDFLFEGVTDDNAAAIATEVRRAIGSCEPRVLVDRVEVTPADGPTGRFDIEIFYRVRETNDEHNLVVPFYAIPGEGD